MTRNAKYVGFFYYFCSNTFLHSLSDNYFDSPNPYNCNHPVPIAMNKLFASLLLTFLMPFAAVAGPIDALLDRIDPGLSQKLIVEITPAPDDFFEISQSGDKPKIVANNKVSAAAGVHWYLKYHAGVQLCWERPVAAMPPVLPPVAMTERRTANVPVRYYLNYCTFSYSMPFWNEARWQQEVDWMALHGVNMPLMLVGSAAVWRTTLRDIGYPENKINSFVAGPAYQAWWLMNNLQGWGGPQSSHMYDRDARLGRFVADAMRQMDMQPVLPGYSGMVPADADTQLGLHTADPGLWLGYVRPAFLLPTDSAFAAIARIYYSAQQSILGRASCYAMDPFHEGGGTDGVDLSAAGKALLSAAQLASPGARWVIQAWQNNPRAALIDSLPPDDVLVLDLFAESMPQCGDPSSPWYRPEGFGSHPRVWCMLLNYGGNVGLHGKLHHLPAAYYSQTGDSLMQGIGMTMEGIENNSILFELLSELPWRDSVDVDQWIESYTVARYGRHNPDAVAAWCLLGASILNAPPHNRQQGTTESLFCARPSLDPVSASTWANSESYYDGNDVIQAARLLRSAANELGSNPAYQYDLVDVTRQANAEQGRQVMQAIRRAAQSGDSIAYRKEASRFLDLILRQDSLLATHPAFRLDTWVNAAAACGNTPADKDLYVRNALTLITTWGSREASDQGGLHDYAHREWSGLLKGLYYERWKCWFEARLSSWPTPPSPIDWWQMETDFIRRYPTK